MLLKRITLSGFKSFADRVNFDFGPGVTCIVGPNGCGKSNVLDSLKWVLGEQSARSLRGRQMTDMIFAGSSTRRSSSVACVELLFGNEDRALPLDEDEVTITRKLYRSGESEYLLNQHTTRLKDIRELFMDTGVGVDAYSVIEQGRVDGLLQSSPRERRTIFEEAAGISKYKARKREAQRKLDRTQQNLLRVEDVVEELERRLRSVKLQAGKARNYQQYETRQKELRSTFVLAEYHRLVQDMTRLRAASQDYQDRGTGLRTEIDRHEALDAEVTVRLDDLADRISATDNELVQVQSAKAAQEERTEAAGVRVEEQTALAERTRERLASDQQRCDDTRQRLAEASDASVALTRQAEELRATIGTLQEADRAYARDLTQVQAVLEDEKSGIIDLLRQSARVHNEIVRLNSHRESLVGQKGRLSVRDAQVAGELQECLEQKASLDRRMREVEALIARQKTTLSDKKEAAERLDTVARKLTQELASAKERRSALESRRELLEDLQRHREGVGTGVRRILDARSGDADASDGVVGLVADLIDADVEHARIIEAVLGQSDQHLVVTNQAALLAQVERVGELPGRLTALCLDRLAPVVNERDFSEQEGFVARALDLVRTSDLVRTPEEFGELMHHLFGKTIVVESLDVARRMADTDVFGHRFVTVEGELIEPDGRISLGPATGATGLISRRSELRSIDGRMIETDELAVTLADQLERTEAEVSYLARVQQDLQAALQEANTDKVESGAALQQICDAIDRLTHEKPLIAQEVAVLEAEIEEVLDKSVESGGSLSALEKENQQREASVVAHKQRLDTIVSDRQRVQEELTEAKVVAGKLAEKKTAVADTIAALRRSLEESDSALTGARTEIERCRKRIEEARETIAVGRTELGTLTARIDALEATAARLRREREGLRLELQDRAETIKNTRRSLEETEAELHQAEMALAETNVRRDELVARVAEELDIDLVQRYEACAEQEQDWEQDWEQVEAEITDLRQKMDRLGNVNLGAIDELAELEQRHGFLTEQRDDLNQSRRQLEQLIERLDVESRRRFSTAFEQIRDNFRTLFRKLFGGGRADIILENPDDALECGIEIVAQPPGKELQIISLMSGGEKSLTAIALLMSIFKCRPAPFAILDEVDAALDEANNDRFNMIIQEFVSEAQFIVITHSKRTMSIAQQLYGITMQEPGVSTRVSVHLADAHVA